MNPFNMRCISLKNFPINDRKCSTRIAAINRFRDEYPINCPFKSINLLTKLLQNKINEEINNILQKYRQTFLEPVLNNVRQNLHNNDELINQLNINAIMHHVLDEAKKMFPLDDDSKMFKILHQQEIDDNSSKDKQVNYNDNNNHLNNNQQQSSNYTGRPRGRPKSNRTILKSKTKRKRKKLIATNTSMTNNGKSNEAMVAMNSTFSNDKWDPSRLSTKTLFVLGSKANKALGFGAARGRLYSKHSNLFRYIGDHEDKEWLHKNHLMPTNGGKAYLLVRDDIIELLNSDEYRQTPGVDVNQMGNGFTVPQSMIDKISITMRVMAMKKNQQQKNISTINKQTNNESINGQKLNQINYNDNDDDEDLANDDRDNDNNENISNDDDDYNDKDFTIN